MNRLKTGMLLATLTALILWIGHSMGGREGIVIAMIVAGAMNFVSYWWSDKLARYECITLRRSKRVRRQSCIRSYRIWPKRLEFQCPVFM
jgi:Zn-dependent protease with chaperone function